MRIAIIGGGASGTLVAVQLLRNVAGHALHIQLIEKSGAPGPGLAYATRSPQHLLNVPAARMSALPDDAEHFLRWLRRRDRAAAAGSFAPRGTYGEYLRALLREALEQATPGARVEIVAGEAVSVRHRAAVRPFAEPPGPPVYQVALRSGRVLTADRVVLALGNFPPVDPPLERGDWCRFRFYRRNPWQPEALQDLRGDEPLLLIGTGLTAVDCLAELHNRGHRGRIIAVSRHGLLPHAHECGSATHAMNGELSGANSVRKLLRVLRDGAAHATALERGWRGVMDAVRPRVQVLWLALPAAERSRFLRHARAYWDVHRHRVAPEVHAIVQGQRSTGQLDVRAARLVRCREESRGAGTSAVVTLRRRGGHATDELAAARVINCTGPATRLDAADSPLLRTLLDTGLARGDPLGLGLDVDARGALLDCRGRPSDALFAIGPLRRGVLWETTAIPEIRVQAAELADTLRASVAARQTL